MAASVASAVLIFMHGLGDQGHSWEMGLAQLRQLAPHVQLICPDAPVQPVTLNGGMRMPSWHDIRSLDKLAIEDFAGIEASREIIRKIIAKKIEEGVPSDRIMLGGFSQGAAMALFTGLTYDKPLAGIIALSGYLAFDKGAIADANKKTELLIGHGTADQVVNFRAGQHAFETLKGAGVPATFRRYDMMGHSTCGAEMRDVFEFVQKKLPSDSEKKEDL